MSFLIDVILDPAVLIGAATTSVALLSGMAAHAVERLSRH